MTERPSETEIAQALQAREHIWGIRLADAPWHSCLLCGVVHRADGGNKPCRGKVGVSPRAPDIGDGLADNDCDDVTPCWCGESNPLFDDEGLDATCGGSGTLICHCGGDLCVCHHHGETECPGCEHCTELEGDDDGPFEDGDDDGPGWCDRCSPDPCTCDDGPDDLSDLGPLDEDEAP